MTTLDTGDTFPALEIAKVGGGVISLPDDLAGSFGVVLVNRGAWCPYCTAQLASFQRAADRLDAVGVRVVSFSVDDEPTAAALVAKHTLTFPVGHSADADSVAGVLGSFVNREPRFLQSTGFLLAPDGTVLVSVYSSGAIGRLVPEDVAGMVEYVKSHS